MSQENIELIRRQLEAFNRSDADVVSAAWTEDAEWRPALTGGGALEGTVYRGPDGIRAYLHVQAETWRSVATAVRRTWDIGPLVLLEVSVTAVGRSSGVSLERTTWNLFKTQDGKISAGTVYLSQAEALEAAGLPDQ